MRGEGVLRDHSQPRPWSRKRTLNGCKMKRNFDNVVLIDVDGERFDNVIIIDVPESLQHKIGASSSSSKGKKFRFRSIISIDDDEDVESPDMGTYGACDMESDTSSGKSFPASDNVNKSVDLDDDECQVVQEKKSAFRVSKCQQVSGKDPFRCRYGLYESSSSDSDGSDCEVMEGSFGPLHKEWVKASLKRKSNAQKGKSGLGDQASPSCFNNDATPNVDVEVGQRTEQHSKSAFYCNSNNANNDKLNSSPFVSTGDRDSGTASLHPGMESPFGESDKNVDQKGLHTDRQSPQGHSSRSNQEESDKQYHPTRAYYMHKHQNFLHEHFNFQGFNCNFHDYTSFGDEEASLCKCQQSGQTDDNNERVAPNDKHEEFSRATSSSNSLPGKSHHAGTGSTRKNKQISEEGLVSNSQPFYETGGECGVAPSDHTVQAVFEDSFGIPAVFNEKAGPQNVEKLEPCDKQFAEAQSKQASPCVADIKGQVVGSMTNNQLGNGMDLIHAQSVSFTPALGKDIINEREKLKETDEYKRAMEEEWASRHLQLQIQAEEAKRLRKKKRAETMRLLDMERRQKLRLEEIRETQKKDQENMNLKEQLRAEIRKELYKLETTCIDMASLLRALGIHVGGSFHPLSQEIHAAYKRALLRFHPDRASKTDIRQQVEAEEKFKLISRMKEKLLLTI